MRVLSISLFNILISLTLLSCTTTASTTETSLIQDVKQNDTLTLNKDTISIIGVGDIMLGSAYPDKSNLQKDDAIYSFKNVADFLK